MERRRIGILTSGGDCPGLNAVIRGAVRSAQKLGWEIVGFKDGFEGLLPPGRFVMLDRHKTAGIMPLGGTILGTTNKGHFVAKVGAEGTKTVVAEEVIEQARRVLKGLRIEGLIIIGGDGSLTTAQQLYEAGIPTVGVPKTIDNDLAATAMTFGFDSAVACVADALDRLHTTATSHRRVMVIEVMGRHAGWIALYGGLAGGADIILLPEIPFEYSKIAEAVRRRNEDGCLSTMIVVAEGAKPKDGAISAYATASGEYRMGGIADLVAANIQPICDREVRVCVLGHLQRGGAPTTLDRILGTRFGIHAVEMIAAGKYGHMVSYQNYLVTDVPISEAVNRLRLVSPEGQMVKTARAVDIDFGD
jgi:phosphofructokinase-like protein